VDYLVHAQLLQLFTNPIPCALYLNSKCSYIEIYTFTDEGPVPTLEVPIYGRVSTMHIFRPPVRWQSPFNFFFEFLTIL